MLGSRHAKRSSAERVHSTQGSRVSLQDPPGPPRLKDTHRNRYNTALLHVRTSRIPDNEPNFLGRVYRAELLDFHNDRNCALEPRYGVHRTRRNETQHAYASTTIVAQLIDPTRLFFSNFSCSSTDLISNVLELSSHYLNR